MQFARGFWTELSSLANQIEHTTGSTQERRRDAIAAYMAIGSSDRQSIKEQLQIVRTEVVELERMIVEAEEGGGR